MAEKPSWQTSTLSQVWFGATIFYGLLATLCAIGVIFFHLPFETAEKVIVWPTWLWSNVTSAYLTARKVNGGTNGTPEAAPQSGEGAPPAPGH